MDKTIKKHDIKLGDWQVNFEENLLISDTETVVLLPKVALAIEFFVNHPNSTITFDELNSALWPNEVVGDNSIYNLIGQVRKVLGDNASAPKYIETISKKGYKLIAKVEQQTSPSPHSQPVEEKTQPRINFNNRYVVISGILSLVLIIFAIFFSTTAPQKSLTPQFNLAEQYTALASLHARKPYKEDKLKAIEFYEKVIALSNNDEVPHIEVAYLNIALMALIPSEQALFFQKAERALDFAVNIEETPDTELLKAHLRWINDASTLPALMETYEHLSKHNLLISSQIYFSHALFVSGYIKDAIELQQAILDECSTCVELYRKLANSHIVQMNYTKAAKLFNQFHTLNQYKEGDAVKLAPQGTLDVTSLRYLSQYVTKHSPHVTTVNQLNELTLFYLNAGAFEKAISINTHRDESTDSSFFSLYTFAALAGAQRDFERSLKLFALRQALYSQQTQFAIPVALTHWLLGNNQKALAVLENKQIFVTLTANIDLLKQYPQYTTFFAALLNSLGHREKATDLLTRIKENLTANEQLSASQTMDLALVEAQLNQPSASLDAIEAAISKGWVTDFSLHWWRFEDNPFLRVLKQNKRFNSLIDDYYQMLASTD